MIDIDRIEAEMEVQRLSAENESLRRDNRRLRWGLLVVSAYLGLYCAGRLIWDNS